MTKLEKILAATLFAIFSSITIVSGIAFAAKKAVPGAGLEKADAEKNGVTEIFQPKKNPVFTKIGQIRCRSKIDSDGKSCVIVVTPVLEYKGEDLSFEEELDRKLTEITAIITSYFSSATQRELSEKGEDVIKEELLQAVNGILTLQKIKKIYFNDYLFF